jgi:tRNA (cmo5U34)-methyltransferase
MRRIAGTFRTYPLEMSQFHFTPDEYLDLMHAEVPAFDELQERVAAATRGPAVHRILELGTGSGETARLVLLEHPEARLTGIDVSEEMLAAARDALPREQIDELLVRGIEDPLPSGPFDLVISALAIHHLDGPGKADLFRRLARVVRRGGRFVMGDVIVPTDPEDAITPLSPDYDMPSSVDDLLGWLEEAGFDPEVVWRVDDLAVISSDLP